MLSVKQKMAFDRAIEQALKSSEKTHRVYIMLVWLAPAIVKIGCTTRSGEVRRFELKLGNPSTCPILCEVPAPGAVDVFLKGRFAHLQSERESFRYTEELRNYIPRLKQWAA